MELELFGNKMRIELILLCMFIGGFIALNLFACACGGVKEGFAVAKGLTGAALNYSMGDGVKVTWEHPNKDYSYNSWFRSLEGNTMGLTPPFPTDLNKLDMLSNNQFDPDCCPATYSNSMGCACVTPEQMKYLNMRGGNRTFNTEF